MYLSELQDSCCLPAKDTSCLSHGFHSRESMHDVDAKTSTVHLF